MIQVSEQIEYDMMRSYFSKMVNTKTMKSVDVAKKSDFKKLCNNLMKEMHWKQPDEKTVEIYAVKKHMMLDPHLKDLSLMDLPRQEYEVIMESEWAKDCAQTRPINQKFQKITE